MALIVEDGTGLSTANSYLSEADADTYHTDHGNPTAWSGATSAVKEEALRLATQYLDNVYGQRWRGVRIEELMALQWPRSSVVDYDGFNLLTTALPQKLQDATAEMALKKVNGDTLLPDVSDPSTLESIRFKATVIESEKHYIGGKAFYKRYSTVDRLVAGLIHNNKELQRG